MCGGSKQTTKQTSTYKPTAEASGLYSNIINQATQAAATPYNPATASEVAGFTPDQLAAFGMVGDAQGAWTPYTDQASQLLTQAAGPISAEAISGYMDPYQQMVIDAALAQQQRADAVAQTALKGNAVAGGALGGNAVGIQQAQLAGEQGRNRNSMLANLLSGGYSQALNAAQSDAARQAGIGAQFGQLGQMVQGMSLNDIMARLSIGNQQQAQQQNVLDTATANAQAETMWPYQNAQWLASIGAGIGPLTGGTTTGSSKTQQGKGIGNVIGAGLSAAAALSDRRAKEDARVIGKTFDGQNVYSFRYKGSPKTQIGLMADEVQQHRPEAVGVGPYGLKTVDYDRATRTYANGGPVGGSAFGDQGANWFGWAPITASQPVMPQLAPMSSSDTQSDPMSDPAQAIKLGKSARTGIDNILRSLDPAKGWGASIEPTSGASIGKGLSAIGSLFGFRDGGAAGTGPYSLTSLVDISESREGRSTRIPIDTERANMLTRLLINDPAMYGDNAYSAGDVMGMAGNRYPESLMIGDGFANGGSVNLAFLSPDVMSPYDIRPNRTLPLKDEFIGEIGASGIDDQSTANERMMRSFEDVERLAANKRMMQSFEEAERAGQEPWYRQSLTDLLGITTGRTDSDARLSFPTPPNTQPAAGARGASELQIEEPSPWSIDNGAVRYRGRTLADMIAGRPGVQPAIDIGDIDANSMPFVPAATNDMPMPFAVENSPYSKNTDRLITPDVPLEKAGRLDRATAEPFDTLGFIRQQEGYRENAYSDRGQWSIGYGTRGREGEKITRGEAERRLRNETGRVEKWLDDNITVDMTPQQRAGLVSFGFNLGTDNLDKLKNDINVGDWGRVAGRMRSFNKARNEKTGKLEPVQGLTDRRIREAALVSGGSSTPAPSTLPDEVQPLVSKGSDTGAPETGEYTSKQDRQTGGLLKRLFGIDFNPLRLDEDERQALLVAGLSMMSSGDVGAGGLQGMRYLQQKQAADREAAVAATKLGLEMFKTGEDIGLARERLDLERAGKPTDDARNYALARQEGFTGSFMDFMREKRMLDKGGAEIPAEVAARIGLGRVFMRDVPGIKQEISQFTAADRADLVANRGRAADVWRRIESGREALVRQLTGAGMSQAEAENQARRYQISPTDRTETMIRKVEMLERDLAAVEEGALAGKTGTMSRSYQSGVSSVPQIVRGQRARNPKTGQTIQFDGSAWTEVRP